MGNYAVIKAGIAMMTRQYCRYLRPYNVRERDSTLFGGVGATSSGRLLPRQSREGPEGTITCPTPTEQEKFEAWLTGPENLPLGGVATSGNGQRSGLFGL